MPVVTFSEAFPKRGRGRSRGRGAGRGRGRGDRESFPADGPPQAPVPFHGAGRSLLAQSDPPAAAEAEGQQALRASGVFAEAPALHPHTSYLNAVQSLQRKQDDAAEEALMARMEQALQQQRLRGEERAAGAQVRQDAAQGLQLGEPQECMTNAHEERRGAVERAVQQPHAAGRSMGMQGQDHPASRQAVAAGGAAPATIDLCSSDDDEPSPHAPPPKRRPPAAAAPAAASYPMGPTRQLHPPQRRPDTRHKATGAQPGASARRQQPGPPRLGIPDSPRGGGQGARGGAGASWMFGGEGAYVPDPRAAKVDMRLRLHEVVDVLDIGLVAHHARAVLDSGNAGHTLITAAFARRLGLLDAAGRPKEARQRTVTVHGVVANAAERIPLMTLTYELRGTRMTVTAGVTEASLGCDILLSCREIAEFISDGFIFDVR